MHSERNNIEIMINSKADEVIEELFQSLLSKSQIEIGTSTRRSDFIFDWDHLYYKCNEINFKWGGSYIDTHDWIKKAAINAINKKDNKCFQ